MAGEEARAPFQDEMGFTLDENWSTSVSAEDLGLDPDLLERLADAGPLCFLDFEATGLDTDDDDLIEAGALLVDPGGRGLAVFSTFIKSSKALSAFIRRLTGISDDDLAAAPAPAEVFAALDEFIGDAAVVAHNTSFEGSWLRKQVNPRFGDHEFLETLDLFALVYPDLPNMKLDTLCRMKLGRSERHRALDDTLDTARLVLRIFEESAAGDPAGANARKALEDYGPTCNWLPRLKRLPVSDLKREPPLELRSGDSPRLKAVPFDVEAIADRLLDQDAGASVIAGYAPRQEQVDLMRHVFACFKGEEGRSVRLCEAGTGIGKTLAYLAVAIPFARSTGEQVLVTTSSKLLQRQLLEKDIPAAAALMGYPDLRFTSIKGRANYLCRARLDDFLDRQLEQPGLEASMAMPLVAAFARSAGHGEVDRIPQALYQMNPGLDRYRREITSSDASECSRQACESCHGDCVLREARARLEGAEIAVTNHDLLLRWPPDYPKLTHLVVDEIHDLAERADAAYAQSAEAVEISHRLETVAGSGGRKPLGDVHAGDAARRALDLVELISDQSRMLSGAADGRRGWVDELAIPADGVSSSEWQPLVDGVLELAELLDRIGSMLDDMGKPDDSPEAGAASALLDAAGVLNTILPRPPSHLVVRFRGLTRKSRRSWRVVATPVSPAADFQCEVLDRIETLFGTSATVCVGEDLRGSVGALELSERAGSRYRLEKSVGSPFDYEKNLDVVFLSDRTEPSSLVPRTADAIATVAGHLGGRTLALFTSRERLEYVAEALDARLASQGITVIAPATGSADPHDLVRTFMSTDNAVLLGARAFWQGVDIPGDACQAVIIEKLPFDVPSDPLIKRRGQLVQEAGGHPFGDYSIPRMLLRLKQMVGRLIRTPDDKGIVVVVDPRSDRRYFSRLRTALPPGTNDHLLPLSELDAFVEQFSRSLKN